VRGQFLPVGKRGRLRWQRRIDERANARLGRWVPPGHTFFTPLWRLDKIVAFPYHDMRQMAWETAYTARMDRPQFATGGSVRNRGGCSGVSTSGPYSSSMSGTMSLSHQERAVLEGLLRANQEPATFPVEERAPAPSEADPRSLYEHALNTLRDFLLLPSEAVAAIPTQAPPSPSTASPGGSLRSCAVSLQSCRSACAPAPPAAASTGCDSAALKSMVGTHGASGDALPPAAAPAAPARGPSWFRRTSNPQGRSASQKETDLQPLRDTRRRSGEGPPHAPPPMDAARPTDPDYRI